jgi:hypothetical protein
MSNPEYVDCPRKSGGGAWVIVVVAVVGAILAIPLLLLVGGLWFVRASWEASGPVVDQAVQEKVEAAHAAEQPAVAPPVGEATEPTQEGAD